MPAWRSLSRLDGPLPALPRPLDALSERWASLRPRVRLALIALAAICAVAAVTARVRAAESRWGGAPVTALVATEHLAVGDQPKGLRATLLPPQAVPSTAVTRISGDESLALALPEGAVLTQAHLDPRGPAAGLDPSLRAVPVPVHEGWAISAGGWVDVWVLGAGEAPAALVARSRPILDIRSDAASMTALVGLHIDEVSAATAGLALGKVLLAHAPAPGGDGSVRDGLGQ
ncbi:MAG TPA: hypothetical protein VML96_11730 [Egibacteraceae bacterium]|nr:hypothetical protein [Egibacteraceae bacterium]